MVSDLPHSRFGRIAVYCGASSGTNAAYIEAARALGKEMCKRGIKLVYGGADLGLMGEVGRTVAAGLGDESVMSVTTAALVPREISGRAIGQAFIVKDIHERKKMMADNADAFIALPGGYGTLEELLEVITWQQLGFHVKPIGVLNINGYFDHLIKFVDHMVSEGFVRASNRGILQEARTPAELIDKLQVYEHGPSLLAALANESKSREAGVRQSLR